MELRCLTNHWMLGNFSTMINKACNYSWNNQSGQSDNDYFIIYNFIELDESITIWTGHVLPSEVSIKFMHVYEKNDNKLDGNQQSLVAHIDGFVCH